MTQKMSLSAVLIAGGILMVSACKREKKDADSDIGHAAVTTIEVLLTSPTDTVRGRYKDPDGPGGRLPTIDTLHPRPSFTYSYALRVLDESGNPTKDLTEIVFVQQKNTHRMFFFAEPDSLAVIEPTDSDELGRPVGRVGVWRQGAPAYPQGTVRMVLRHYMNPSDKNFGLERGSTDIDIRFPVHIRN